MAKPRVLYVFDRKSRRKFLVDTGATISLLPSKYFSKRLKGPNLYAVNGSQIPTYGQQKLDLHLSDGKIYPFEFQVARVRRAILGVDFLYHHNLAVDVQGRRLVDLNSAKSIVGKRSLASSVSASFVSPDTGPYTLIFSTNLKT